MRNLAFRPARGNDWRFIVDSYLESFKGAHAAGMILMEDWPRVMGEQWRKILALPGIRCCVAYDPTEEDDRLDIYGWIAYATDYQDRDRIDRPMVVYCYVKTDYRTEGIATRLLAEAGVDRDLEWYYWAKTAVLSKPEFRHALRRAKWDPITKRYPPRQTPKPERINGKRNDHQAR